MPRKTKGEFDTALMSKLIALFSAAEGPNAFRQALKHCEDCGLAFDEGCALIYGASDTDLLAQMETLKAELLQAQQDNAELVDRYDAELAKAQADATPQNMGVKAFLAHTWAFPQCRMVLFTIIVAIGFGNSATIDAFPAFLLGAAAIWMFLLWATALHGKDGYGPLIVKTLVLGFGLFIAFGISHSDVGAASVLLIFVGVFTCFRLIENLMKLAGEVPFVRQVLEIIL